jgi:spore coat protein A
MKKLWPRFTLGAALSLVALAARAETVTLAPLQDNSMFAESPALSNGQSPGLFSGRTNDAFERRALVKFDISNNIPPGSTVTAAELRMYVEQAPASAPPLSVDLRRLITSWGEGTSAAPGGGGTGAAATPGDATWMYRFFDTSAWTTPGGDFDPLVTANASAGSPGTTITWTSAQLVADIQDWIDTPANNHGWVLVSNTTGPGQARRYASRETADASTAPALEVEFNVAGNIGACCNPDGTCGTVLDPGLTCSGTYQGIGTSCSTTTCPQPTGACCIADANATCLDVTAADCTLQGGTYQGNDVPCASDLCPVIPTPFIDPLPIPSVAVPVAGDPGSAASYEISFKQFEQQLHSELPPTTMWGYDDGTGARFPGPIIEASVDEPVDVTWINDLRDDNGQLRTNHFLPVDMCPHGAEDVAKSVVHLHGAHVAAEYDGYPELTLLPGESSTYLYPNDQPAAMLWYHDHALGITRLNVAMGMAGAYIIRDAAEAALNLPDGAYEIPLVITDRSFTPDGQMKYPAVWTELVFGETIIVNGRVWPYLNVNQGKYRFRVLNASSSRTYRLGLSNAASFHQIGSDGGLLEAPIAIDDVTVMPGERVDLVMDFSSYAPGTQIELVNDAAAPYPGPPGPDDNPQVMRFVVQGAAGHTAPLPAALSTVDLPDEAESANTRQFELIRVSENCAGAMWTMNGLEWDDITELPQLGTSEIWTFINRSGLAHPMHMHLVLFKVLDRQTFTIVDGNVSPNGPRVPPIETERGYKDTVRVEPGEIVRVIARFEDYVGRYAYHCHLLEHEDHGMMRQFETTTTCGDGAVGQPLEGCDDGNFILEGRLPRWLHRLLPAGVLRRRLRPFGRRRHRAVRPDGRGPVLRHRLHAAGVWRRTAQRDRRRGVRRRQHGQRRRLLRHVRRRGADHRGRRAGRRW